MGQGFVATRPPNSYYCEMTKCIWLFLFIVQAAWAMSPQKIVVGLAQRQYELTLTDEHLLLQSDSRDGSIQRMACSEPLIQEFWRSAQAEIQKFPKIKAREIKPYAAINDQAYLLRSLRSPASVANLDGMFWALLYQEREKCTSN